MTSPSRAVTSRCHPFTAWRHFELHVAILLIQHRTPAPRKISATSCSHRRGVLGSSRIGDSAVCRCSSSILAIKEQVKIPGRGPSKAHLRVMSFLHAAPALSASSRRTDGAVFHQGEQRVEVSHQIPSRRSSARAAYGATRFVARRRGGHEVPSSAPFPPQTRGAATSRCVPACFTSAVQR